MKVLERSIEVSIHFSSVLPDRIRAKNKFVMNFTVPDWWLTLYYLPNYLPTFFNLSVF
jgi:hypothetical protein